MNNTRVNRDKNHPSYPYTPMEELDRLIDWKKDEDERLSVKNAKGEELEPLEGKGRPRRLLEHNGVKDSIKGWANRLGIPEQTMRGRLLTMTLEKALTLPHDNPVARRNRGKARKKRGPRKFLWMGGIPL